MNIRLVLLILVVASGLAVAGAVFLNVQAPPKPVEVAIPEHMVVVAAAAISTGSLINAQDLRFAAPPEDLKADLAFERPRAAPQEDQAAVDRKTLEEITGAVARRRFEPGEPLVRGEVVKPGDSGFLAAVLQPGMRAITIGVTAISGTAGLIYPGDRVDVVLTQVFNGSDMLPGHRSVAETLANDVRVLAIDQQLQAKASQSGPEGKLAQTVTLEVEPRKMEQIVVGAKLGDLSLAIRSLQGVDSSGEATLSPAATAVWAEDASPALREDEAAKAKAAIRTAPPPAPVTVNVMRGDKAELFTAH